MWFIAGISVNKMTGGGTFIERIYRSNINSQIKEFSNNVLFHRPHNSLCPLQSHQNIILTPHLNPVLNQPLDDLFNPTIPHERLMNE